VNDETYPLRRWSLIIFPRAAKWPPLKLTWYDGGLRPPRPKNSNRQDAMAGSLELFCRKQRKNKLANDSVTASFRISPERVCDVPRTLPRSPGHYQEWIDACKGGKPAESNFGWAGPLTETVLLETCVRSQLAGNDEERDCFGRRNSHSNSDEANKFSPREYRRGGSGCVTIGNSLFPFAILALLTPRSLPAKNTRVCATCSSPFSCASRSRRFRC